ncbi:MAG: S1C family serine protease [Candidatus Vogelbacteria bacterium]
MEELNKNQIVLLVLLVSFVTSIATGIVTVTLMDQAPAAVTQTINRIVERTVEKVVPGKPPPPIIKEVQVIVTEEDLIVKVINGAMPGIVRIIGGATDKDGSFLTSGFFVSSPGVLVADSAAILAATSTTNYQAILAGGQTVPLTRLASTPVLATGVAPLAPPPNLIFFHLTDPSSSENKWSALTLSKTPISIGQTVVALGYSDRPDINVAVGIVSSFLSTGTSTKPLVVTNAASGENLGGPLLNIKGEVIGLSKGPGLVIPVDAIATALPEIMQINYGQ